MMTLLEQWAEKNLVDLGVDDVFTPYIVGMVTEETEEAELKESIHEVLMGWIPQESQEKARKFVDELIEYNKDSASLKEACQSSGLLSAKNIELNIPSYSIGLPPVPLDLSNPLNSPLLSGPSQRINDPSGVWDGGYLSTPPSMMSPSCMISPPTSVISAPSMHSPYSHASHSMLSPYSHAVSTAGGNEAGVGLYGTELNAGACSFVPFLPSNLPIELDKPPRIIFNENILHEHLTPQEHLTPHEHHLPHHGMKVFTGEDFGSLDPERLSEEDFLWSVAHELIEQLLWKFPEYHPASLLSILNTLDMDVNEASKALRCISEKENSGVNQVCRHFMQGECRRADCMFLHNTDRLTCRFWIRGVCAQSDSCIFLHGYDPEANEFNYDSEEDNESDEEPPDLNNEEKFPSLGVSSKNVVSDTETTKKKALNSITSANASNLSLDFARAVNISPSSKENTSSPIPSRNMPFSVRRCRNSQFGSTWLTTGQIVGVQYKKLRAEAGELAKQRNQCFMKATACYRSGDKAKAKELSLEGHEYNERMKCCHLEAAREIFRSRNPASQVYQEHLLDLHGLHVAEAVEILGNMLPMFADEGVPSLRLVTGSGHHSGGPTGKARVRPAVERFLQSEGYHYAEIPDIKGHIGMLMVTLYSW